HFERDNLVFAPGEDFQFEIAPYLMETPTAGMHFRAQVTGSPGGHQEWSQEYESGDEGTSTTVTIKVPQTEGGYDLTISAVQPTSRFRNRFQTKKAPLAERKVQFVVLGERPQNKITDVPATKILEINPVNPKWSDRLSNVPWIPGARKGPLGNGD